MARSPSRSPTRLPSPLPFPDSSEKRKWHEKEEYYQYYYSSQQQQSNPRGFEQSRHVPARLHKTPPPLKEIKDHSSGSSRDGVAASRQLDNGQPASRAKVIATVLFYLVAALVMVMANKWVLNSVQVPLFFLLVQLVIAVVLLHISAIFGYFTIPQVQLSTCTGLLPLISINVTGLIFNTYCLQYVDASFYQVARGLVLPFTVLFSFILLGTRSSAGLLISVGVVCLGFFLGVSSQHINASAVGTMLGVFSSLTTSVHAIVVKKSLNVVKGSTMDLVYYNNLLSAILLAPLVVLSGEWTTVMEMVAIGGTPFKTFMLGATITGLFGFLICIAGFLSIKVTSPVTHMISSAVRGVIQTFLGKWIFGDIITAGRGFGILFILLGSTLYTYIKDREQRKKDQIAAHGRESPALTSSTSLKFQSSSSEKQPQGLSSAHNSPVLSSSSTFDSFTSMERDSDSISTGTTGHLHSRSSTMSLGINVGLANSAASSGSTISSPRTPRSLLNRSTIASQHLTPPDMVERGISAAIAVSEQSPNRRLSYDSRTSSNVALLHSTPSKKVNQHHQQNGRSYQGSRGSVSASNGHDKAFSLTDLQDVLISAGNSSSSKQTRYKEEKMY